MTNKEKFLVENVGFHFEDLSLTKQIELEAFIKEMKLKKDWVLLALSKNPIEKWEEWGFGLFRKPEFKAGVDAMLDAINNMSETKFKQEINRKNQNIPQFNVSEETYRKMWKGVKEQGKLYTDEEAEARCLTEYWTYNRMIPEENYAEVDALISRDWLPEDLWGDFVLSVKRVIVSYIDPEIFAITPDSALNKINQKTGIVELN